VATIGVGSDPAGVAVQGNDVWVANGASSTLTRIDARSRRVRGNMTVPINPYELTTYHGELWVTSLATGRLTRIRAPGE
jgi:DNA-binding beta-propeller fold protein YncE